jgi:GNAT superfamily N-acetyltransferase
MAGLDLLVRPAVPADLERLVPLFQALSAHYALPALTAEAARARLALALFGQAPRARLLLAAQGGRDLGFLTWNTSFPAAGLACRLVIEDIFVLAEARGQGVGLALLRAAAREARRLGAEELSWTTEAGNRGARRFYERIGAVARDKVVYRMAAATLLDASAAPAG